MIGIQSFWTKPYSNNKDHNLSWNDRKYFYISWILSNHLINQKFSSTELVTDTLGKHLLIDILKLKYNKVSTDLDIIPYDTKYWTFGKIVTFSKQNKPFIHIDYDAFLFKENNFSFKEDICVQNIETDVDTYYNAHKSLYNSSLEENIAYNTGIVGGEDLKSYYQLFEYMEVIYDSFLKNTTYNSDNIYTDIAIYVEQYGLFKVAKERNKRVSCLLKDLTCISQYSEVSSFNNKWDFTHVLGYYNKKRTEQYKYFEKLVQKYCPKLYFNLIDMLERGVL
ncbi:DUF6734 family protein [Flammeovirga aprica]|uniref:DUF6734 domain-containing protein n=1 Tax=Flammeovirga aprica JL-4 TaxID=694437 RepID=A0A7X9RQI6_9BACT|nr:DUF6734 family protein [Flammeovirga aprica]NME66798.1 hypothetical protein [Flammeovirga aprica JL-4]